MITLPRRKFLTLAAGLIAAPVIVRASAIMPVKALAVTANKYESFTEYELIRRVPGPRVAYYTFGCFDAENEAMRHADTLGLVHRAGEDEGGPSFGVLDDDIEIWCWRGCRMVQS